MIGSTPCQDRDDWFVSDNRGGRQDKTEEEREQAVSDMLRAKLICLTRCPVRKECMETALSYDDNHYWVWGGYSGGERARIAEEGGVPMPKHSRQGARGDRTDQFIDYHLLRSEAASLWGMTARAVESTLHRYIWDLRVRQDDPWVILPEVDTELPGLSGNAESVRAA